MEQSYAITKELPNAEYENVIKNVTEYLKDEGFGVLTEIDVKATLKQKLDVDFRRYVILGACNPSLAHKALTAEPLVGVLLPCNVVVMERDEGGSLVAAFSPSAGFELIGNAEMHSFAAEVEVRLQRVVDRL